MDKKFCPFCEKNEEEKGKRSIQKPELVKE